MLLEKIDFIEVEGNALEDVSFEIVESDLMIPAMPTVQVYSA